MSNEKPANGSNVSVGTMANSVIQQNSPGAVASIRVVSGEEAGRVGDILQQVAALIDSLPLSPADQDEMREDIGTAKAQLQAKRPKAGILSTCLKSLMSKLTMAVASPLALELASSVQVAIDQITALLGSL